jgi:hypothetical protein
VRLFVGVLGNQDGGGDFMARATRA